MFIKKEGVGKFQNLNYYNYKEIKITKKHL